MGRRVEAVLTGDKPDHLPFIDRLELWYKHHMRMRTMPTQYQGLSLNQVHRAVGMGQERFCVPYGFRLRGVQLTCTFEDQVLYREENPITNYFPSLAERAVDDRPGVTTLELLTPVGKLRVQHEVLQEMVDMGEAPYQKEHLIKDPDDLRTVEYIIEHAEYVSRYDTLCQEEKEVGEFGYVVLELQRIPFQQVLLEYLGEVATFYTLHDSPGLFNRLIALVDQQMVDVLHHLAALDRLYVEFADNLHGPMTNPRLFSKYCLPYYQRYADILHAQGKRIGSHTDGDIVGLLALLAESGLDVCESFSPFPLTSCTFEQAWQVWSGRPLIWGGIPSPMLEQRTSEGVFRDYIRRLLDLIDGQPIILGVGDMVMGNNMIERVRLIAEQVELIASVQ